MTAAETPKTLFEALARFQADLPRISKDQTADTGTYKYDYADLASVSSAVLPRLGAVGLAFFSRPTVRDGQFGLAYSLVHGPSGEREDGWYDLPANLSPQKIGGLITYARRYCLCAVTGVAPAGDDDDAAGAEADHRQAHGNGGYTWEDSAPARPQQNGEPSFYRRKLAEARAVTTDAAATLIMREAASAAKRGLCTPDQATHIQNAAQQQIRKLTESAKPVDVEDLARQAQRQHNGGEPAASAANGSAQPEPAPGDDKHRKLIGAVQQHFKRLGFTDDDRGERLWAAGKLAQIADVTSLNDLHHDELSLVADTLAKCKDRKRLEEVLAAAEKGGAS